MGVIVHLAYKNPSGGGVPSPVDGKSNIWPLDFWASLMEKYSASGVTVPLLPPVTKGASLGGGWDPFDHYDLGNKIQSGRRETRYGGIEQLRRFVAIANRNGMEVAVNVVHHHVDGDSGNCIYQYLGADGKTKNGRFPKYKNCFWLEGPQNPDHVPDPQWDMSFGREFRWLSGTYGDGKNGNGPGYVGRGLIDALEWQLRTIGVRQIYLDDLKGTSANYIAWLVNELKKRGLIDFSFGEYYDGNPSTLYNYIHSYPNEGTCGVQDFTLRFQLRDYCNGPGNYDMRNLLSQGLIYSDPFNSVTFTEDADTDESGPIFERVLQACAAISTLPGYPMHFGKQMYKINGCYGLEDQILNLSWIHEKAANGPMVVRKEDYNYIVFERPENPGLLVGLCNRNGDRNNRNDWTPVTVQTAWWPGTRIHDHTGHSNDQYVNNDGSVTIWLPPSDGAGLGYVAFSQFNIGGAIYHPPIQTKQTLFGAEDLDIGPATTQGAFSAKIWPDYGTEIHLNKEAGSGVRFEVSDEHGNVIIPKGEWSGKVKTVSWHTITAFSTSGEPVPYTVTTNYTGPKTLEV